MLLVYRWYADRQTAYLERPKILWPGCMNRPAVFQGRLHCTALNAINQLMTNRVIRLPSSPLISVNSVTVWKSSHSVPWLFQDIDLSLSNSIKSVHKLPKFLATKSSLTDKFPCPCCYCCKVIQINHVSHPISTIAQGILREVYKA